MKGGTRCKTHSFREDSQRDTNPFREEFVDSFGINDAPFFSNEFPAQKKDFDIKHRW